MDSTMILLLLPLVALEIILKILCLRDWLKRESFNGLNRTGWLIVFLLINLIGPVAYLVYGRKDNDRY